MKIDRGENMRITVHSVRSIVGACAGVVLAMIFVSASWAQSPPISTQSPQISAKGPQIAEVETLSGKVFIQRGGAQVAVKVGDPLFEQDTIDTGADGAIGITFIDNTVMSAGPNSEVALEEYKFDSNNFKGSMLADMRKGTLDMVSGDIAKSSPEAMKVRTPAAILGVRGTHFVVEVPD